MENNTRTESRVMAEIVDVAGMVIMTYTEAGAITMVAAADAIVMRVWDSGGTSYHVRKLLLD
jgi:hypothetical protein